MLVCNCEFYINPLHGIGWFKHRPHLVFLVFANSAVKWKEAYVLFANSGEKKRRIDGDCLLQDLCMNPTEYFVFMLFFIVLLALYRLILSLYIFAVKLSWGKLISSMIISKILFLPCNKNVYNKRVIKIQKAKRRQKVEP